MKNSELRKLVAQYREINLKLLKSKNEKLRKKINEIEHRYYHETGRILKSDLEDIT